MICTISENLYFSSYFFLIILNLLKIVCQLHELFHNHKQSNSENPHILFIYFIYSNL